MACNIDLGSLPLLPSSPCPSNTEWVMVGNAVGGLDPSGGNTIGYARRLWKDLIPCILQGLTFGNLQIIVPAPQLAIGGTVIRVNQLNVIQDSVVVILDGVVLDRVDGTRISYTVVYDSTGFTVTLNAGANNLQTYVLTYAHA